MSYISDGLDVDCEPGCVKQNHLFMMFCEQINVYEHILMECRYLDIPYLETLQSLS